MLSPQRKPSLVQRSQNTKFPSIDSELILACCRSVLQFPTRAGGRDGVDGDLVGEQLEQQLDPALCRQLWPLGLSGRTKSWGRTQSPGRKVTADRLKGNPNSQLYIIIPSTPIASSKVMMLCGLVKLGLEIVWHGRNKGVAVIWGVDRNAKACSWKQLLLVW